MELLPSQEVAQYGSYWDQFGFQSVSIPWAICNEVFPIQVYFSYDHVGRES